MKLSGLSIVLPCHNERDNLESVIRQAACAGTACSSNLEIIVVCDGSTDGTQEEARRLGHLYPSVRVVRHLNNEGYGAAVWSGMKAANLEYVFFTDADGQFDISEVSLLIAGLGEASGVLGYRINRQDPAGRGLLGSLYTVLIRNLLGVRARDMNCAFKLFRRSSLRQVSIRSTGALFNAELLAQLQKQGDSFQEVGVHHYPRRHGQQSGARPDVILRALRELPLVWWDLCRRKWTTGTKLPLERHKTP